MKSDINALYEFIDTAVRSRKYPDSTGRALKVALKLYEAELNDEERGSVDLFRQNIDHISRGVFEKNKLKFSAGSLATYKSRILKIITEYQKYGVDPAKMASWNPKVIVRKPKSRKANGDEAGTDDLTLQGIQASQPVVPDGMHKIELALR